MELTYALIIPLPTLLLAMYVHCGYCIYFANTLHGMLRPWLNMSGVEEQVWQTWQLPDQS